MLAILIMLAGSGFDQHAFEEASFFTTSGFFGDGWNSGTSFRFDLNFEKAGYSQYKLAETGPVGTTAGNTCRLDLSLVL